MRIVVVSPKNKTVFNFRGDLIKNMITHGNDVYVTGPNQEFVDDILALGVKRFIEVPMVKDNTSVKDDLRYVVNLKHVMQEIKPDIVFAYNIKPVVYGSVAAKMAGVNKVYALVAGLGRVYSGTSLKKKVLRLVTKTLYTYAFKICDRVMFQNGNDIDEMVAGHYLPRQKAVQVNGSGVNMKRFERFELPVNPAFLMVGRIIRDKGIMEYCEAARMLKKEVPNARCILLGGFGNSIGDLNMSDIKSYIEDGSIEFPGEVKDPVSYYKSCSVFVLPSYYREGLPRTILEAMACGRPIITTDWPGCREPIVDSVNGYLVPIKDPKVLAEKMLIMASNRELVLKMGEAAYAICKSKYAVEIVNQQMQDIMRY